NDKRSTKRRSRLLDWWQLNLVTMFFRLHFFKKSNNGICADDFKNKTEIDTINLKMILSLSELLKFETPLSGRYVGKYAMLTMSNNDKYYIHENSFADLSNAISMVSA